MAGTAGAANIAHRILGLRLVSPGQDLYSESQPLRDAIDRNHHWLSLYTPAADQLHELLVTAGGAWISEPNRPAPEMRLSGTLLGRFETYFGPLLKWCERSSVA